METQNSPVLRIGMRVRAKYGLNATVDSHFDGRAYFSPSGFFIPPGLTGTVVEVTPFSTSPHICIVEFPARRGGRNHYPTRMEVNKNSIEATPYQDS